MIFKNYFSLKCSRHVEGSFVIPIRQKRSAPSPEKIKFYGRKNSHQNVPMDKQNAVLTTLPENFPSKSGNISLKVQKVQKPENVFQEVFFPEMFLHIY